ncbi:hypothetical protein DDE82_001137 [Stemphylium lycopersici]|uniref:2EXR domain-containing protein n=1 Tax=Stemphylium lycopersici TaxID=183478 RepID=A0A364NBD7_STELY|nr:hypothetical protein DDE82_001137 [Stemphylium lycopersici]RAR14576.1 hypothetical protein DDE83_001975 [Stemphylium lycopersici]
MSAFTTFSKLPKEIRDIIWLESLPTTATVDCNEAEFDVTSISPLPAHLFISKEAQTTAQSSLSLTPYPIWGSEKEETLSIDHQKMILEIVINPIKSASLNTTWMDIWSVLGDALPAAKQLHIACQQTERLARLLMLEEAEWLGVGAACNEAGLFDESVSGERKTREALHTQLSLTTSKYTVAEIDKRLSVAGIDERIPEEDLCVWKLVDHDFSTTFGPEAKVSSTKAFLRVEVGGASSMSVMGLHNAAKDAALPFEEEGEGKEEGSEDERVKWSGVELTEEALTKYLGWAPKEEDPGWKDDESDAPANNAGVMKWLS